MGAGYGCCAFPPPPSVAHAPDAKISRSRRRRQMVVQLHQIASLDGPVRHQSRPASGPPGRGASDCIKRDMKSARARWGEKRVFRGATPLDPVQAAACRPRVASPLRWRWRRADPAWQDAQDYCAARPAPLPDFRLTDSIYVLYLFHSISKARTWT